MLRPTIGPWQRLQIRKMPHWNPLSLFPLKTKKTFRMISNTSWSKCANYWKQPLTPPAKAPWNGLIPWKMMYQPVSARLRTISIPVQPWHERWQSRFLVSLVKIIPAWIPFKQILFTALISFGRNTFPPTKKPYLLLKKRKQVSFISWRKALVPTPLVCSRIWRMSSVKSEVSWNLSFSRQRMILPDNWKPFSLIFLKKLQPWKATPPASWSPFSPTFLRKLQPWKATPPASWSPFGLSCLKKFPSSRLMPRTSSKTFSLSLQTM